jgi:hypothetical protein
LQHHPGSAFFIRGLCTHAGMLPNANDFEVVVPANFVDLESENE